ncbi:MAG: hypothetical protein HYY84_18265 [Deltaproteobacteria bacterium]|nr:hypothetical protein [Deltaproteobacteria bacterium]
MTDGQLTFVYGFAPFSNGSATRLSPPASGASLSVAQSVSTPADGGTVYYQIELASLYLFAVDGGAVPMLHLPNVAQGAPLFATAVTSQSTGILVRTTSIPTGTTHVTAAVAGPLASNQIVLPVSEGSVTAIGLSPGAGFAVSATAVASSGGTGRLFGAASASGIILDAGTWVSVDLQFQPLSRSSRATPTSVVAFQPLYFDDSYNVPAPSVLSNGYYYYRNTPFINSEWPSSSWAPMPMGGLDGGSYPDAGVIRFLATSPAFTDAGTLYYQFRGAVQWYVSPPGGMSANYYDPDTDLGQSLNTVSVADAAATLNLTVTGIPSGATHVIAALQGGPTSRSQLVVPFDGGTGALSIECYPGPPSYDVLVATIISDAGPGRLISTGLASTVAVDSGVTPVTVALTPISRTERGTPLTVSGYQPFQFDETFAIPSLSIVNGANIYYRSTTFTNSDYPASWYVSGSSADAGSLRFWQQGSSTNAAPGPLYYQFRGSLNYALTPPNFPYSVSHVFPDTQAGQPLETIAVADAAATIDLTVNGVPTGTTHVTAALQSGPTSRNQIWVPFDGGTGRVAIECHFGPPNYEVLVSATIVGGGTARLNASGVATNVAVDAGTTSASVTLAPASFVSRGTPSCVVAGSPFQFDETFAVSWSTMYSGDFYYQTASFTNTAYPSSTWVYGIPADAGQTRYWQQPYTTTAYSGPLLYYQFRGQVVYSLWPPDAGGISAYYYYPDTQAGQALQTITVNVSSCP